MQEKELFSRRIRAGKRTYFFDVKQSAQGDKYLVVSESRPTDQNSHKHERIVELAQFQPPKIYADPNSKMVLEEGTGFVKLIIVAYKTPDDRILVEAGPVLSYYEFKRSMSDRLTDEKWRELLKTQPPKEPEWIPNFAVREEKKMGNAEGRMNI